ncbi:MAG: HlyD family secretion protein, partial [Gemmataceae bacterium]|nr:HlyD family secretion protein [Gemmataceae bacterium]
VLVVLAELQQAGFNEKREQLAYERAYKLHKNPIGPVVSLDQLEEQERRRDLAKEQVPLVKARKELAEKSQEAAEKQRAAVDKRLGGQLDSEEAALKAAKSEQASVQQQYNTIKIQVERQANQRVFAATDGTIFRVLANAEAGGQLVRAGERLAILVPDIKPGAKPADPADALTAGGGGLAVAAVAPLTGEDTPGIVAELLIDGNDLPLVRNGDRVLLQFEGWAAVQFAAYPEAATGTFEGRVYLIDPTSDGQGKFRILVEPAPEGAWPDEQFLRQGVRAQGWVLLNKVTVGWEVWRLLNGFPPAREVKSKDGGSPLGPVQRK